MQCKLQTLTYLHFIYQGTRQPTANIKYEVWKHPDKITTLYPGKMKSWQNRCINKYNATFIIVFCQNTVGITTSETGYPVVVQYHYDLQLFCDISH